jgi:hypothetical protein
MLILLHHVSLKAGLGFEHKISFAPAISAPENRMSLRLTSARLSVGPTLRFDIAGLSP